jgi:hypothetical protein
MLFGYRGYFAVFWAITVAITGAMLTLAGSRTRL